MLGFLFAVLVLIPIFAFTPLAKWLYKKPRKKRAYWDHGWHKEAKAPWFAGEYFRQRGQRGG